MLSYNTHIDERPLQGQLLILLAQRGLRLGWRGSLGFAWAASLLRFLVLLCLLGFGLGTGRSGRSLGIIELQGP